MSLVGNFKQKNPPSFSFVLVAKVFLKSKYGNNSCKEKHQWHQVYLHSIFTLKYEFMQYVHKYFMCVCVFICVTLLVLIMLGAHYVMYGKHHYIFINWTSWASCFNKWLSQIWYVFYLPTIDDHHINHKIPLQMHRTIHYLSDDYLVSCNSSLQIELV